MLNKLTVLLLLVLPSFVWAQDNRLTLAGAAEAMFRSNPAYLQKGLQAEAAAKQESRSKAAYYPQLDFTQNLTRSDNPVFVFGSLLNQRRFSEANFAIDSLNEPDPLNDVSSRFQLGWLIYDFGRREAQVGTADSAYKLAQLAVEAARSGLLQELVRRYYGLSLAQQRLATAQDTHASAQSRREQAQNRVQEGVAVEVEALSAEVYLARTRQELIDAENQVRLAQASLRELLGGSAPDSLETDPLVEMQVPSHDLSYWMEQMRQRRPELKMVAEQRRISASRATAARAGFLPSIQAFSAYEWHGKTLDYTGDNWTAGVELRWNLFGGFSDSAELSAARLQEREAELKIKETENALTLQLEGAYYRMAAAEGKMKVAAAVLDQAAENRRIYADRYAAGLASIQDSLQAEAAHSESRLMYLMNLYDLYVAHSELLAAAGLPELILTGEES